jgi:hypothetical protein
MMSIGDIIESASDKYVARRIMMHILGYSPEELLVKYDSILSLEPHTEYNRLLMEVVELDKPLAYVLGYEIFY